METPLSVLQFRMRCGGRSPDLSMQYTVSTGSGPSGGMRRWLLGTLTPLELAKRVWREIQRDDCFGIAAGLAYYLLFLVTLIGFLPIPDLFDQIMSNLSQILPGSTPALVENTLRQILQQRHGGLLSIGLIITLWTASSALAAVSDGLNRAYGIPESRPFWKVRGIALLLTVGLSVLMVTASILAVLGGKMGEWIGNFLALGIVFQVGWEIARWVVSILFVAMALALVYRFAPDVKHTWRWMTPGSLTAVVVWIAASFGFSYYVSHFGSYNKTYGAIGTIIILLTWFYISGFIILAGGEMNSEIERSLSGGRKRAAQKRTGRFFSTLRSRFPLPGVRRLFPSWALLGGGMLTGLVILFFSIRRFTRGEKTA
jgi:membrane protein